MFDRISKNIFLLKRDAENFKRCWSAHGLVKLSFLIGVKEDTKKQISDLPDISGIGVLHVFDNQILSSPNNISW